MPPNKPPIEKLTSGFLANTFDTLSSHVIFKVREGVSERWGVSEHSVDNLPFLKGTSTPKQRWRVQVCMHLFLLRKSDVPLRNGSCQLSARKHPTVWKPPPLPYVKVHQLLYTTFHLFIKSLWTSLVYD